MVATIATRQLHFFFSSSFPIEEKRTNPFPIGFHPSFPTIFKLHAMVNRFQIFLPSLPLPIFEYFRNCWKREGTDGGYDRNSKEERTNLSQQDSIHLLSNNFRVAMVNRLQIFLPSLPLSIFEYFRNCGREREKDGMATIATRQLHSSSSPFPIEEEERTSLFQQDFIPLFQQFSSCTMVNRFQIFLPFLPLPIFEIVDCFN